MSKVSNRRESQSINSKMFLSNKGIDSINSKNLSTKQTKTTIDKTMDLLDHRANKSWSLS